MRRRDREAHWYYRGGVPPTPGRTRRRWRRFVAHCRQSAGHVRLAVVEAFVERRRSVAIAALVAGLVTLTYFGGQLVGGGRPPNVHREALAPHIIPSRASLQPDTIALHGVEQASLPDTAKPGSSVSHAQEGPQRQRPPSKSRTAAAVPGPSGSAAPPAQPRPPLPPAAGSFTRLDRCGSVIGRGHGGSALGSLRRRRTRRRPPRRPWRLRPRPPRRAATDDDDDVRRPRPPPFPARDHRAVITERDGAHGETELPDVVRVHDIRRPPLLGFDHQRFGQGIVRQLDGELHSGGALATTSSRPCCTR